MQALSACGWLHENIATFNITSICDTGTILQIKVFSIKHYKTSEFSNGDIQAVISAILKNWVPFYSLSREKSKNLFVVSI